ncbi:acyl-CoA thioesterase [Ferruginibacter profundus]
MKQQKDYKIPAASETVKTEVVCPNDTNPMGILQGGKLVEWMDIAAAVCAQTHAGKICVTASINQVDFNAAANIGDIITICASITRAFNTSVEIFVQSFARKVLVGKKYLISEAYFTFVALDEKGNAVPVPAVKPVSTAEKERFNAALLRRRKSNIKK